MTPNFASPTLGIRHLLAALWIVAACTILTWWVKGDLEMGWLLGMPLILGGSALIGAASGLLLRSLPATLAATAAATALGAALLYVAIETPHGRSLPPPPELLAAAGALAEDRAAVEAAARSATGLPVEVGAVGVEPRIGYLRKEGFSFRLARTDPGALLVVSFAVGPTSALLFDLVPRDGSWGLAPRDPEEARRERGLSLRAIALERRLPGVPLIEVGGQGPHAPGSPLLVRIARGESDWDLVLFRVGEGEEALREVRRYPREEILRRLEELAAGAGLGPLGNVVIYFRPTPERRVLFMAEPVFHFNGTLAHPRYHFARFHARLAGETVEFALERTFTRPPPGSRPPDR